LQDDERMVTREEGLAFAEEAGCLFLESSAKTRENVEKCFEELALKVCLEIDSRHNNVICLERFFP
jgi:Ras-related protein Rab-18